ncbi:metallophosphatase [Skermanella stibiiresistens SB22]|uniref:Metallophosphatase n=1 Tax=Skermanella stibiiresistens SB22 TaxID=1385369 RepID=W9H525_9PROT|nr:phosphodiesterase [Skermanella stibiiresistens]EWY41119.1 metallophosphatase [Skermanella stibiiresistens SB22]
MLIAQISDLHVTEPGELAAGRIDTATALATTVARLNALRPRPDLVVITGDLANGPHPGEYEALARLLAPLEPPWCAIPGNHDDRDGLRRLCAGQPWLPPEGPYFQYVIDHLPVRVIALDTLVPGETSGLLCGRRTEWLERRLSESDGRPTVLLMHHPPHEVGVRFMDALRCFGTERLGALVGKHPEIERILCGHVHRPTQVRWHGTISSTAPSAAFLFALDLDPEAPAAVSPEPPAMALHLWRHGHGIVSHLVPISP